MRRVALWILLMIASSATKAAGFDLDALRHLPDIPILEASCVPPVLGFAIPLPAAQLVAAAAKLSPERRDLAWLLFLRRTASDAQPIEFTLGAPAQPVLDAMRTALSAAGFGRKADVLAGAHLKATSIGGIRLVTVTLPAAFGNKAELGMDILAYVRRTPELAACLAKALAKPKDDVRLGFVVEALTKSFAAGADPKTLPQAYRVIWLANQYVGEVDNGGIEQFFANSSGDDASETATALRTLGLEGQAATVSQGMAMFGVRFPQSQKTRRALERELGLDPRLDALTAQADTKAVTTAMAGYARREDILPK